MITWLWQASEERLAILLQFLVLVDHDLVHEFFEDEQLGESTNAAAVCSEITSQYVRQPILLKVLKIYPMRVA